MQGSRRKNSRSEQKAQLKVADNSKLGQEASKIKEQLEDQIDLSGQQGRWTKQEHKRFVEALSLHGKNWKKVEEHVETRSGAQIRSHAQKFFNRLEREFHKQFNGLKSSEIKLIFENKDLHDLSFCDNQQRRRSDSIHTNVSLDQESDKDDQNPVKQIQINHPPTAPIDQNNIALNDFLLSHAQDNHLEKLFKDNGFGQELILDSIQQFQQKQLVTKIYQFMSAYNNFKESYFQTSDIDQRDQESASHQEKSSNMEVFQRLMGNQQMDVSEQEQQQENPQNPDQQLLPQEQQQALPQLSKKHSVSKIGQDESLFYILPSAKYNRQFSTITPNLKEYVDISQKVQTTEKPSVSEHQPRSRRGSFVFYNEDESENESKYQQLKKVKGTENSEKNN